MYTRSLKPLGTSLVIPWILVEDLLNFEWMPLRASLVALVDVLLSSVLELLLIACSLSCIENTVHILLSSCSAICVRRLRNISKYDSTAVGISNILSYIGYFLTASFYVIFTTSIATRICEYREASQRSNAKLRLKG